METKFTKGEWLIAGGNFIYSLNDKDCNQFSLLLQGNGTHGAGIDEIDANAHLIAAAPDGYKAAIDAIKLLKSIGLENSDECQALISATSKARGES